MKIIPLIKARDLPWPVINWCVDNEYPVHCGSAVIEIPINEPNPMLTWLTDVGFTFSPEEVKRGWGYAAIQGT